MESPRVRAAKSTLQQTLSKTLCLPVQELILWVGQTLATEDFVHYLRDTEDEFTRGAEMVRFIFVELADGALLCRLIQTLSRSHVQISHCGSVGGRVANLQEYRRVCEEIGVAEAGDFSDGELSADPEKVAARVLQLRNKYPPPCY